MARPKNHKQLIAEVRACEKYIEREVLAEVLGVQQAITRLQEVLKRCPDTQFYFEEMEEAVVATNKNLLVMDEVMDATFKCFFAASKVVRKFEGIENNRAEMKREANDEQSELL
jgi:hypothetical protein